jgi:tRNA (guanine-N7-)-methyltransferase
LTGPAVPAPAGSDDPPRDARAGATTESAEKATPARLTTRSIRSFVLRQGRMSPAQTRAFEDGMARFGVPFAQGPLDFTAAFGRAAPVIAEIGFGMGETTARIAAANPQIDFIGIEVHAPGVGALLKLMMAEGLTNVRVIRHDAVEVLERMIPPGALAGVHLFFPDPWPKARHHKRRIVQPDFAHLVATRLAPGGVFHCATDWVPYAEHMLAVLSAEPLLANTASGYAERPALRPRTKFESRGLNLGHEVRDVIFRRP